VCGEKKKSNEKVIHQCVERGGCSGGTGDTSRRLAYRRLAASLSQAFVSSHPLGAASVIAWQWGVQVDWYFGVRGTKMYVSADAASMYLVVYFWNSARSHTCSLDGIMGA